MFSKTCGYCEKPFLTNYDHQNYCNTACRDRATLSNRRYGGNHFKVLKRDGFKCTKCHSTKDLHVHHLDEVVSHTGMSNLVTLCRKCHLEFHSFGEDNNNYKHVTKEQIERAIESTSSLEEASKILGISRGALRKKREMYGMNHLPNSRKGSENGIYIHLSLQEIEMAYELEGNWIDAAKRLGVSDQTIRNRYKELKGSAKEHPTHKNITKEQIVQAYEECGSWKGVMDKLGIAKSSLTYNRKKYGLM